MSLFQELKRRNVFRVGIAYVLVAWVALQIADFTLDLVGAPNWVIQTLSLLLLIGLPIALIFAWAFEMTPEGVKRESEVDRSQSITPNTGRKLDRVIIVVLVLAVGGLLSERFLLQRQGPAPLEAVESQSTVQAVSDTTRSVAVLPFVAMSSGPDDEYFSDGLTEEILNSLAQLPELLVTSRTSSFLFKGQDVSVEEVAEKLGVDHVVEGSVRRSGERMRITAQLIRADDGFHLWSETYDSGSSDAIAVQEDIAEKVAEALDVVLDDDKRAEMEQARIRDVEAFIAFQKARELFSEAHSQSSSAEMLQKLKQTNDLFDVILERVPDYAVAWILRADYYTHLLVDSATGVPIDEEFADEVDMAAENMLDNMRRAAENPWSESAKLALQLDLGYLGGNWRGVVRRLELFTKQTGCAASQWGDMMSLPFGYAEPYARRLQQLAECDPLLNRAWSNLAAAWNWAGNAPKALEALGHIPASSRGDHDVSVEAFSLAVAGRLEEAHEVVNAAVIGENNLLFTQAMLAAAQGDEVAARGYLEDFLAAPDRMRLRDLPLLAMVGDREGANALAARFDAHPYGYIALPMVVALCACGAPWDIENTPGFKARFDETGLEWPPVRRIGFPLKDW